LQTGRPLPITSDDGSVVAITFSEVIQRARPRRTLWGTKFSTLDFAGSRLTVKSPEGQVAWRVHQEGRAQASHFQLRGPEEQRLGIITREWMYDGRDAAVARYEPVSRRPPFVFRVVDIDREPLANLRISNPDADRDAVFDIEFLAVEITSAIRMLTIALAYSKHRELTEALQQAARSSWWDTD